MSRAGNLAAGWRVLAAAPAMTGSLMLLVVLAGGLPFGGGLILIAWLSVGLFILTPPGEVAAVRLLCRFRRPTSVETASVGPVLSELLRRSGFEPGGVDLFMVRCNDRNAYAAGRRSVAITTGLLADHVRGRVSDRELGAVLCHELSHLVTRSVRLIPMTTWLAMPLHLALRSGVRIVKPVAARQPKLLLGAVVLVALTVALEKALRVDVWSSVAVLAGIGFVVLLGKVIDTAASRVGEHDADRFAALCGYGGDLYELLRRLNLMVGSPSVGSRMLSRHPEPSRRLRLIGNVHRDDGREAYRWPTEERGSC